MSNLQKLYEKRIQAEQTYLDKHPSYRVDIIHCTLMKEDSRYQKIFNTLKDMGYKPRRSTYYPQSGGIEEAITISSMSREIPNNVHEYLNSFEDIHTATIFVYTAEISRDVLGYKIKFCLYDKELQRLCNEYYKECSEKTRKHMQKVFSKTFQEN